MWKIAFTIAAAGGAAMLVVFSWWVPVPVVTPFCQVVLTVYAMVGIADCYGLAVRGKGVWE